MKRIAIVTILAGSIFGGIAAPVAAQTAEDEVEAVVDALFDGMRAADSAAVRGLFHPEMVNMASSGERDGIGGVEFGDIDGFVRAVGGAEPGAFDERIGPAEIRRADGERVALITANLDGRDLGGDHGKQPHCGHLINGVALPCEHHEGNEQAAGDRHGGIEPP